MEEVHFVSIIINNYNYASFLNDAVESALSQTYHPVEVIVVDDGSTDGSREIIAGYGDRVVPILKENGGQPSALNAGFERSRGEVVIFLDADDCLLPDAVENVMAAFRADPDTARVQYRMEIIDALGKNTGVLKPAPGVSAASGDLRRWELAFPFDLRWLPTSGNAFAARVLRQIMPVPGHSYGRIGADWYLIHLASLYGPVVFLDRVLACYRVHGNNSFDIPDSETSLPHIRQAIEYSRLTDGYLKQAAQQLGMKVPKRDIVSVSELANRLTSLKCDPAGHPVQGDTAWGLVRLGISTSLLREDVSFVKRMVFVFWFLAMTLAPHRYCLSLAQFFFNPQARGFLNRLPGVKAV